MNLLKKILKIPRKWTKLYSVLEDDSSIFGTKILIKRGKYKDVEARIPKVYVRGSNFNFSFEIIRNNKNFSVSELKVFFSENVVLDILKSKGTAIRSVDNDK